MRGGGYYERRASMHSPWSSGFAQWMIMGQNEELRPLTSREPPHAIDAAWRRFLVASLGQLHLGLVCGVKYSRQMPAWHKIL